MQQFSVTMLVLHTTDHLREVDSYAAALEDDP